MSTTLFWSLYLTVGVLLAVYSTTKNFKGHWREALDGYWLATIFTMVFLWPIHLLFEVVMRVGNLVVLYNIKRSNNNK